MGNDLTTDGLWTHAANINGRCIRGTSTYGRWRWLVEGKGPAFEGVHMQIFYLAGETLGQAQILATKLGELSDAEDESDKVRELSKSN